MPHLLLDHWGGHSLWGKREGERGWGRRGQELGCPLRGHRGTPPRPPLHELYLIDSHWSLLSLWGREEGGLSRQQGAEYACSLQSERVRPPHPPTPGPQAPRESPQGEQTGRRGSGRVPGEEGGVWASRLGADPQARSFPFPVATCPPPPPGPSSSGFFSSHQVKVLPPLNPPPRVWGVCVPHT